MKCKHCKGPIKQLVPGIWYHDNTDGWYAGQEMHCNAEPTEENTNENLGS